MFESWQDIALTIANAVSLLAALPSIFSTHKPSVWTSGLTALTLSTFALVYISLGFWMSGVAAGLCAATWFILWGQKYF